SAVADPTRHGLDADADDVDPTPGPDAGEQRRAPEGARGIRLHARGGGPEAAARDRPPPRAGADPDPQRARPAVRARHPASARPSAAAGSSSPAADPHGAQARASAVAIPGAPITEKGPSRAVHGVRR